MQMEFKSVPIKGLKPTNIGNRHLLRVACTCSPDGAVIDLNPAITDLLTINREFTASIVIVRCQETGAGSLRWHVRFDTGLSPDITVAVRMDPENRIARDYYLLPRVDMALPP